MPTQLSKQLTAKTVTSILLLVIIFHILVLLGIIPFVYVWGGRLESKEEMLVFEAISIAINLVMILVTQARVQKIRLPSVKISGLFMWLFAILFALNTVGNLLAKQSLETYIFTPITLILAILFFRLALKD